MPGLSRDAKMTYAYLLRYMWEDGSCFPGLTRLCADLDASDKSISGYLHELERHNLIRIQRRGKGLTNVYHLLPLADAGMPPLTLVPPVVPEKVGVKTTSHPRDVKITEHSRTVKITGTAPLKLRIHKRRTKTQILRDSLTDVSGADALPAPPLLSPLTKSPAEPTPLKVQDGPSPSAAPPPSLPPIISNKQDDVPEAKQTTSMPWLVSEACLLAQGRPATRKAVLKHIKDAETEVVEAYRPHGLTLGDAKACLAYLLTDPWVQANLTCLTPAYLGAQLGPWLMAKKPTAKAAVLPPARTTSTGAPIVTGISQMPKRYVSPEEAEIERRVMADLRASGEY